MDKNNDNLICNWCHMPSTVIWVHGHGQCSVCGTNIEECCRGEICCTRDSNENSPSEENDDKEF